MRSRILGVAAAAFLAAPGVAAAATITAVPSSEYQNPNIEIDAGESVSFHNLDFTASHDVTSIDAGPGGTALFRSETVGFGTEVPVVGAEKLTAGRYDFICSVHSFMTGSITVKGGGGGGDGTAPKLSITALDKKLSKVEDAGALRVRAKVNEPATVKVRAIEAGGGPTLAKGKADIGGGSLAVSAKLTAKGKRAVAKAEKLKLEVKAKATDDAGNASGETLELTLR